MVVEVVQLTHQIAGLETISFTAAIITDSDTHDHEDNLPSPVLPAIDTVTDAE